MVTKHYLITGGSGFIGTQLCKQLLEKQQKIIVLTRNTQSSQSYFNKALGQQFSDQIRLVESLGKLNSPVDIIVNLAGQGILDKRWTDQIKQQLIASRVDTTKAIYEYVKRIEQKPELLISGSAIGYYGLQHGDQAVTESADGDNSFASQLCVVWEEQAKAVEALGVRTCYLRTGIVLGDGGALAQMLPPFKFGLGGPIGDGQQWMPWIHINDLLGIIHYLCENESISGAINGTAPNPVRNKEFATSLGKALKRPAILPMPAFVLKLLMGQGADELLIQGAKVVPERIQNEGYEFQHSQLDGALRDVLAN